MGIQRPVLLAGGLPLTLPQTVWAIDDLLDTVDGVLLAPGRDIAPAQYGQEPHPLLAAVEPQRDVFEMALTRRALELGRPVLGVCRGMQVLNVALGGTLVQDVTLAAAWREHPSDPGWHRWRLVERSSLSEEPLPEHPRHEIEVTEGSILGLALGVERAEVNSFHHQAVDRLGAGLVVSAVAVDGVVEAIELPGREVLGVQWELQEEYRMDERFLGVFQWFVEACASARPQISAAAAGR